MTRARLLALCLLVPFAFSCRGCQRGEGASLLSLAPASTVAAMHVPNLEELAAGVAGFAQQATRKAGGDLVTRARASFSAQLGFDPFSRDGWEKAGVDATSGALLFTESVGGMPVLVVRARDAKAFDAWLTAFVQRVDGASQVKDEAKDGLTFKTAGRPFGDELAPAMHWAHKGDHVFVARAEGLDALVSTLKRLSGASGPSLEAEPVFARLAGKVPPGQLRIFARGPAPGAPAVPPAVAAPVQNTGALTSVQLGATGLSIDSFLGLAVPGLAKALDAEAPLELAKRVEDDAVLVLLSNAARPEALAAVRAHPLGAKSLDDALAPLTQAIGIDAEKEVVPLLSGPLTAALHVVDAAAVPQKMPSLRSPNAMLEFVHATVSAEVKDPAAMLALLERSAAELGKRGAAFKRRTATIAGQEAIIFEPDREAPELGWALVKNVYVYAAGKGRLERAVAEVLVDSGKDMSGKLQGGVARELGATRGASVAVVRGAALADAAAKVAAGQGTQGLGLGALVSGAIELVRTLGDVALSLQAEDDGLRVKVREKLQ